MAGTPFTIGTSFGIGTGPTYQGSTVINPQDTGNNPQLIDQTVEHAGSGTVTIWVGSALYTDLQPSGGKGGGYGFYVTTTALNGNTGTPACTIKFMNSTNLVYSIALSSGQAYAMPTTTGFSGSYTSITTIQVVPDVTSDLEVFGILNFNS